MYSACSQHVNADFRDILALPFLYICLAPYPFCLGLPFRYISCYICVSLSIRATFRACAGLNIDFYLSLVHLFYMHVPSLP